MRANTPPPPENPARRTALTRVAGALARVAGALAASALPTTGAPLLPDDKPLQRAIPGSGESLPVIGLGTWQTFDVAGSTDDRAAAAETLRLFVAAGGRVIDSSPMYRSSESVVGDLAAAQNVTDKLFLATKVWTSGRRQGIEQMQTSAQRLRSDTIDLMQVHNLLDLQTHLPTLRDWKEQGRIRYWGLTHYTVGAHRELAGLIKQLKPDFVQFNFSIATRDAERELLPVAMDQQTAVLINRPFEGSALFQTVRGKALPPWAAEFDCASWAQFFLKYIVSHPAVTCAIPATRKPAHLLDNMKAGIGRLPNERMRQKMVAFLNP